MILFPFCHGQRVLSKPFAAIIGMLSRASRMNQQLHGTGVNLSVRSGLPQDLGLREEMPTDYWSR